jgi:hypothetical protein
MPGKPRIGVTLTTNSKSFAPPWKKSRRFTEANLPHAGGNFSSRFAPRCAQNQRARNHSRPSLVECHRRVRLFDIGISIIISSPRK